MNTPPLGHPKTPPCTVAIIPTCRDMSRLSSRALDDNLPVLMKVRMTIHLLFCRFCRRYARQLRWMHWGGSTPPMEVFPGELLSPKGRVRLKEALRNNGG